MTGMEAVIIVLGLALAGAGEPNHSASVADVSDQPSSASASHLAASQSEEQVVSRTSAADHPDLQIARSSTSQAPGSLWRGLGALVVVLGVIAAGVWMLRRFVPRVREYSTAQIDVLARTFLSSKQSLALVRVGQRLILVGVAPECVSCVAVIEDPAEVAALTARAAGRRPGGPSETFDRYVKEEAAAYTRASEGRSEPEPEPRGRVWEARGKGGLNDLLERVKAMVRQV